MRSLETPANLRACDSIAVAVEEHIRKLQSDGHGVLAVEKLDNGFSLAFGTVKVRAENYDIALLRLANALLDDATVGGHFLARLRSDNPPIRLRGDQ